MYNRPNQKIYRGLWILLVLILCFGPVATVSAHYYTLSECPEEIKDTIAAQLIPGLLVLDYRSEYLGQIVPHIKLMIDTDKDSRLSDAEIDSFSSRYKTRLNMELESHTVALDTASIYFTCVQVEFPSIQQDSLLAPSLQVRMRFQTAIDSCTSGEHHLSIPPKMFFVNGSLLISLAQEEVEFSREQEKAIGRVLQFKMHTTDPFRFVSAFPGYIRRKAEMVTLSGVFYDQTLLQMHESSYPKMRISFSVKEGHESRHYQ